jgi:membrane protein required for colicin V production
MAGIDIVLLIIVGISLLFGLFRGIIRTVSSLLGFIFGVIVAASFGPPIAARIGESLFITICACAILFFVTALVLTLAGNLLRKAVKFIKLGWLDHLLGGLFGFLRGAFIAALLVMLLVNFSERSPGIAAGLKNSLFSQPGIALLRGFDPVFPDALSEWLDKGYERLKKIARQRDEYYPAL